MTRFKAQFCTTFLAAIVLAVNPSSHAHAQCTNPAGTEGQIFYNTTHKVAQFCNGTAWINMVAVGANSMLPAECDAGDTIAWNGLFWDCSSVGEDGGSPPEPADCSVAAGTQWTVSGATCTVPNTLSIPHGGTATASDTTMPSTGSATFACDDGVASIQAGATCTSPAPCPLPWGGNIASGQTVTAYKNASVNNAPCQKETRTCNDGVLTGSYAYGTCEGTFGNSSSCPYCLEDPNFNSGTCCGMTCRYMVRNDAASLNRRCWELGFTSGVVISTYPQAEWCTYCNARTRTWNGSAWVKQSCVNGSIKQAKCIGPR